MCDKNFAQSGPSIIFLGTGPKMCPHTPNETKLPFNRPVNQLGKNNKNQQYKKSVNQQLLYRLTPHKLQGCKSCKLLLNHIQGWTLYLRQRPRILQKMIQMIQTNPLPTAHKHVKPRHGLGPCHRELHPLNWTTNLLLNEHNHTLNLRGTINKLE